jgi:hypothetical protein
VNPLTIGLESFDGNSISVIRHSLPIDKGAQKRKLGVIIRLNIFLSFDQLIDQLLLQNGPNFALIHAMSFHPFVVLLCLELHSREEELWLQRYILFE